MKYKSIYIVTIVLAVMIVGLSHRSEPKKNRYHQHLEAQPKETCTDHDDSVFCTHLPLMEITTDGPIPNPYLYVSSTASNGNEESTENELRVRNNETVSATIRFFDKDTKNNHLTDQPEVEERAEFRIRGASSRLHDKKNYLIKFRENDMVNSKDVSLAGMAADSSWALHGPFVDKSLIRNYLCYNLAGEIMDYAPNVRFCEVFLNNEYQGLYLLTEKIGYNKNGRIEVTKTDPKLRDTSYIIQYDRGANDLEHEMSPLGSNIYITNSSAVEIIYPGKTLTEDQKEYIEEDFSKFEKSLYSYDYADPQKGYKAYIDVQSFVDFFLINEFTLNYDALLFSTYLYKDINGKIKMCVWDFNAAFDYYKYPYLSNQTFQMSQEYWFLYLFKDEYFVDQVVQRYNELRKTLFNEKYLFNYIDQTLVYLGPAIQRNNDKWGYSYQSVYNGRSYDYLLPAERNVRTYDEAIQQIKTTISNRLEFMDTKIEGLNNLCHQSRNKRFNH